MDKSRCLRDLIRRPQIAVLPGGGCALTAKLVEAAGFEAAYMTGYGTSLTLLGLPDVGLTTMTEVVTNAGYMAQAIGIPLLADADTGYGNVLNVRRTVHAFIRAGVAGVHIEDQVTPKRCGGIGGREVIPLDEMVGKVRAALDARAEIDPDFVILARTDALGAANGGIAEVIRRGRAYLAAGADAVVMADAALTSLDIVGRIVDGIGGPFVCTGSHFEPLPDHEQMEKAGISAIVYPREGWRFGLGDAARFLADMRADSGSALRAYRDRVVEHPLGSLSGWHTLAGMAKAMEWTNRYAQAGDAGAGWQPGSRPR
jgi:2-methylisocitrate lyase-like PEP mutase family enzyme